MKKKLIFFMTIFCLFMINSKVYAQEKFYEGEYIDGIYTKSVLLRNSSAHFQKARFFRRVSDNKEAYCIEPFAFFNENESYDVTSPIDISEDTWKKMSLIAHYGYGYKNHTDPKWYAITQLLIWRESTSSGNFFFTDSLNGNRIDIFNDEINEIYRLVSDHKKMPSVSNQSFNIQKGTKYITDDNNVISNFINTDGLVNISDNKIDISNLDEGSYTLTFERNTSGDPVLFYYNSNSQNIMTSGSLDKDKFTIYINIYDTELSFNKIDFDTNSNISSGSSKLCDAKFNLYDKDMNLVTEFSLDEDCSFNINGLPLGKYFIEEKEAGEGYIKDNTLHEVVFDLSNTKITYTLENKVIKKEIEIHKEYGTEEDKSDEKDVVFDIYMDDKYIDTIVTNKDGMASITLPYGVYTFKQVNSLDGYLPVEDFIVSVDTIEKERIELLDYKIKVGDTRDQSDYSLLIYILLLNWLFVYVKEVFIN